MVHSEENYYILQIPTVYKRKFTKAFWWMLFSSMMSLKPCFKDEPAKWFLHHVDWEKGLCSCLVAADCKLSLISYSLQSEDYFPGANIQWTVFTFVTLLLSFGRNHLVKINTQQYKYIKII